MYEATNLSLHMLKRLVVWKTRPPEQEDESHREEEVRAWISDKGEQPRQTFQPGEAFVENKFEVQYASDWTDVVASKCAELRCCSISTITVIDRLSRTLNLDWNYKAVPRVNVQGAPVDPERFPLKIQLRALGFPKTPNVPSVPQSASEDVALGNPITAFLDLCAGAGTMASRVDDWKLDEELVIFVVKLKEIGKNWRRVYDEYSKVLSSHQFLSKVMEQLSGFLGKEECPVCLEMLDPKDTYLPHCAHPICKGCLTALVQAGRSQCPLCRLPITLKDAFRILPAGLLRADMQQRTDNPAVDWESLAGLQDQKAAQAYLRRRGTDLDFEQKQEDRKVDNWGSKFQRIIEVLDDVSVLDSDAKTVIFVQWDDLRSELAKALSQAGLSHVMLSGNIFERTRALKRFQTDQCVRIMLLSLEDSASGTNLTVASHVMLLHPMLAQSAKEAHAAEFQAIGRVRRFGQKRQVHIWRFFTSHSVEESLWDLLAQDSTFPPHSQNEIESS